MLSFQSVFAEQLSAYLDLRRALGFRFQKQAYLLWAFDRYVYEKGHCELTQDLALNFASDNPNSSTNYRAQRYQVIPQFSADAA